MPKKRTHNFKQLQGPSVNPPNAGGERAADAGEHVTVNERLSQLRVSDTAEGNRKKRELSELVNQKSVPPSLNVILGVPQIAPPRPQLGARTRDRLRTPGPAPPESWLSRGSGVTVIMPRRRGLKRLKPAGSGDRKRPAQLFRFQSLPGNEELQSNLPGSHSLRHFALKATAESWSLMGDGELLAFSDIPMHLRLILLTYIGYYGPSEGLDIASLEALVQGGEPKCLDLSGLLGSGELTLRSLRKRIQVLTDDDRRSSPFRPTGDPVEEVIDSWDQDGLDAINNSSLHSAPHLPCFQGLTHLSLSHPPATILWADLLKLSKHLQSVTHLSLAYWPRPTLTPNLATVSVSSSTGPEISAGGSHYYSAMDQDFSEPALLLRQLSMKLLSLRWLDLEGCSDWVPALTWGHKSRSSRASSAERDWHAVAPDAGPDFVDTWKNLVCLNVSQGWHPTVAQALDAHGLHVLGGTAHPVLLAQLRDHVRETVPLSITDTDINQDALMRERRRALMWLDREQTLRDTGRDINHLRRMGGCVPCVLHYGWGRQPQP